MQPNHRHPNPPATQRRSRRFLGLLAALLCAAWPLFGADPDAPALDAAGRAEPPEVGPRRPAPAAAGYGPRYVTREEAERRRAAGTRDAAPRLEAPTREPGAKESFEDHRLRRWLYERQPSPAALDAAVAQALAAPSESRAGVPALESQSPQSPDAVPTASWSPIGSGIRDGGGAVHRSGRVSDIAYAYDDAQQLWTLYLGGSGGGLWKVVYAGLFSFWAPLSDNLPGPPSVGAFHVDPVDSNRIWIGTGDPARYSGNGLYRTLDGGATWTKLALTPQPSVFYSITAFSTDPNLLVASTDVGIFRSIDGGQVFTRRYAGATTGAVQDPSTTQYWYAGAPGIGVLESSDGASSFHPIDGNGGTGIPDPVGSVFVAPSPSEPNYVFALVGKPDGSVNGVYRSANYGYDWVPIWSGASAELAGSNGAFHTGAIAVDPDDSDRLFVGFAKLNYTESATQANVCWVRFGDGACSSDCGIPYCFAGAHWDFQSFTFMPDAVSPGNTRIVLAGDGGYYVYDWATRAMADDGNLLGLNLAQSMFSVSGSLAAARTDRTLLLAGLQDNGVVRIDTDDPQIVRMYPTMWADGGQVSFSPDSTAHRFASHGADFLRFLSTNSGTDWQDVNCALGVEWAASVLRDPTPSIADEIYTYSGYRASALVGEADLASAPLACDERLEIEIEGARFAVELRAGDGLAEVQQRLRSAIERERAPIGVEATLDGRLELTTDAEHGDSFTVRSAGRAPGCGGGTGFGAVAIPAAPVAGAVWWKSVDTSCPWTKLNSAEAFPLSPPFDPRKIDQANNNQDWVFYVSGWADQRILALDSAVDGMPSTGMSWTDRTPPLPARTSAYEDGQASADRSVLQPNTVYFTTVDRRPSQLWVSTNRGVTWRDVTGSLKFLLPDGRFNELLANPANLNQMFVATDTGVYRTDTGLDVFPFWFRYSEGLPAILDATALELSWDLSGQKLLRISTFGRGFWERDVSQLPGLIFSDDFELGDCRLWRDGAPGC